MTGTGERLAGPVDQPKPARRTLVAFLSIESEKMICTTDRDRQEALGCHVPRVGAARVWMAAGQDLRCIGEVAILESEATTDGTVRIRSRHTQST